MSATDEPGILNLTRQSHQSETKVGFVVHMHVGRGPGAVFSSFFFASAIFGESMSIRRQDYRLTQVDLTQYPAWEYALDEEGLEGQDERTVRPYHASPPLDLKKAYFIVRARFHLADGTQMVGYIKPIKLSGSGFMDPVIPVDMNPVIVTEQGQVTFWYGALKPEIEHISQNYRLLNKKPSEVFPIGFAADIEVLDSITVGTLEGFLYCDNAVKDFFELKSTDIREVR